MQRSRNSCRMPFQSLTPASAWWPSTSPCGGPWKTLSGRLRRYLGRPSRSFEPCDYGGWLAAGKQTVPEFPANDGYKR
jgi:hypothetical protein